MQRIPLVPSDLSEPKHVIEAIRARRGGALSNLDRVLLHSPVAAEAWNAFLGTVRKRLSLSPKVREIVMCSVAVLNRAHYEFHHHAIEFERAGGTQAQIEQMQDVQGSARNEQLFDAKERMAFRLTLEMTRDVEVTDATMDAAKALFTQEELVDLLVTIGAYNMVSRIVVACDIHPET